MKYDPLTRILHLLVAVGVTTQMLTSLVLVHPKPGRLPNAWYEVHEAVGITLALVVSAYWLWAIRRAMAQGGGLLLFPWFSRQRLTALRGDVGTTLRSLTRGRLPASDEASPLAGAIQGLGLMLALVLALTGTTLALGTGSDGGLLQSLRPIKEVHEILGPLMWAYLVAHPLLGLLHQISGHRSLSRMFSVR
jgi:cytochrome b561